MNEAIAWILFLDAIALVAFVYYWLQDRKEVKRAKYAKLQQEPVSISETLQGIAKDMKKITREMTDISQKLQEVTQS